MVERSARRVGVPWPLLAALLGLLAPGFGYAALAPPKDEEATATPAAGAPAAVGAAAASVATPFQRALSMLPSMRYGATVGYDMRRDISDGNTAMQRGLVTSLAARGGGYFWEPWVARYTCSAEARVSQDKSESMGASSAGKSLGMSGNAQLLLLPLTKYPFEAHYLRSENRSSSDLAAAQSYAGQSYGFSQAYNGTGFMLNGGWDRGTQNQGRDRQDALQLSGSHSEESQRFNLQASLSRNVHSDEDGKRLAQQANVSLIHAIAPSEELNVDNIVSVNQSDYRLLQGSGSNRINQLSSVAFWRPDEIDLTLNGGVRLLSMQNSTTSANPAGLRFGAPSSDSSSSSNANFNLGASYEFSQFLRFNGSANLSLFNANGVRSVAGNQSAGVGYAPEAINLGAFRYYWSTGASVGRSTGTDASRQASLQLNHGMSRSFMFDGGSGVSLNVGQAVALAGRSATVSAARNAADNLDNGGGVGSVNAVGIRKQLSHSASASWNSRSDESSITTAAQLGVNDARTVGDGGEFFQSINLQTNSNLATSATASWSGNLTVQAARQSMPGVQGATEGSALVTTNSSGSLSYQQRRLFGVRSLRLGSDLRLNSQALLPLLGGPQDQEMAAWDSRIDYMIGRTRLRLTFLITRTATPATAAERNGTAAGTRVAHNYKSIAFAMSRAIGDL